MVKLAEKRPIELKKVVQITDLTESVANGLQVTGQFWFEKTQPSPVRDCLAIGFFDVGGKQEFGYSIEWIDQAKGEYWVQFADE